ncbi:MAG TPA: MgtC/SapB family protein [Burkholderiales bacterium]|nr:MgtC/SapB family protein [Burkholderiales bacterium]
MPVVAIVDSALNTAAQVLPRIEWPYLEILVRLALALSSGLLIGLERERRGKEAGLRTFRFVALLGAPGGSLG